MKPYLLLNSKKTILVITIIALALTLLFLMAGRYGLAMNGDSAAYLSTAESLIAGQGYRIYLGSALTKWPPLYPTLIAVGMLLGVSAKTSAILVNALCISLLILAANHWLHSRRYPLPVVALGLLLVLFAPPMLEMLASAWTELLYITLSLLFIVLISAWLLPAHLSPIKLPTQHLLRFQQKVARFIGEKHDTLIILAGLVTALAFLTRYIGYTLVFTGGLVILLRPHVTIMRRLKLLVVFGSFSIFPLVPWWLRTYIASSSIVGPRFPATVSLQQNILGTWRILQSWIAPSSLNNNLLNSLAILLFICLLILPLWVILSNRQTKQLWRTNEPIHSPLIPLIQSLPAIIYIVVYLVCLVLTSSLLVGTDRMNPRLLSPVYIFFPLVLLDMLFYLAGSKQSLLKRYGVGLVMGFLAIWLIYPMSITAKLVQRGQETGIGIYNIKRWATSPAVAYIDELPEGAVILTNEPHLLYVNKGIRSILTPRTYALTVGPEPVLNFSQYLPHGQPIYLFWFELSPQRMSLFYSVDEMREALDIELIDSFDGQGDVYRVKFKFDS